MNHHPTDPNGPLRWHVSSACATSSCVEVAHYAGAVLVRATERPSVVVGFTPEEWAAFLAGVRRGEFDHPTDPTDPTLEGAWRS